MVRKVTSFIEKYHMFEPGDSIVVGFSGGADSVCLLHLLMTIALPCGCRIMAVHVHHGIRGKEADADMAFCREFCEARNIPFVGRFCDVPSYAREYGMSTEEAGRLLRYEILKESKNTWQQDPCHHGKIHIAVAHHRDDQAETILFHLCRGSDLKGLQGMRPVSGELIRPLLCVTKQEILEYCQENKLTYCTDSTNGSSEYTRNRIRSEVMPMLCSQVHEKADEHIAHLGERMWQVEDFLETAEKEAEAAHVTEEWNPSHTQMEGLLVTGADRLHPYIRDRVLYHCVTRMLGRAKDVTAEQIERIAELACPKVPVGARATICKELTARKENDGLYLYFPESESDTSVMRGEVEFSVLDWDGSEQITNDDYTKFFDYDKIIGSLQLRHRESKDYLVVDKEGHTKSLNRYFIDEKIPARLRDKIWVLADGNHVIWIIGYRISEAVKVDTTTAKVLKAEYVRR